MRGLDRVASEVIEKTRDVHFLYHQVILLTGSDPLNRTEVLRVIKERLGCPLINVSLRLSERLLGLSKEDRSRQVSTIFQDMLYEAHESAREKPLLLDNGEILFDPSLQTDALKLILLTSRDKALIVSWPGRVEDGFLVYAEPSYPEYQRNPKEDLIVISLDEGGEGEP